MLLKLQTRLDELFIPHMVKKLLSDIVQDGEIAMQIYLRTSKEFFGTALSYLEARNENSEHLPMLSCLL
jgi:hypothetical protein